MDHKEEGKIGIGDSERCIEIPWALSKYSNEQTVLDIGYANAEERYITALLSLKIPNLYGIDISKKSIYGIISHLGDIRSTEFEDNFFDLVFCISTIEHIGRDNSVYIADFSEDLDNGDFEALKEIHRITKNKGKIVFTVPFGKFFNYGWFIHYDENRLNKLLCSSPFEIVEMDFFRYKDGWQKYDKSELTNTLYKDNDAPAAAGLVCVVLEKRLRRPLSIQKETANELEGTMSDNTIEIRDDHINVEEIMEKIRENIHRRRAAGELPPDSDMLTAPLSCTHTAPKSEDSLQPDFTYINSNWDIHNNSYFISSHHPYIGKVFVKGRQIVNGEVRRYIDPIISQQTEFNACTVRILTRVSSEQVESDQKITQKIDNAIREIEDKINSHEWYHQQLPESAKGVFDQSFSATTTKIQQDVKSDLDEFKKTQRTYIESVLKKNELIIPRTENQIDEMVAKTRLVMKEYIDTQLETRCNERFSLIDEDIHSRTWLAHLLDERIAKGQTQTRFDLKQSPDVGEINYFLFEEQFRGSPPEIKQRQKVFLPYFEKCSRVLDIGCGRGEFLEILKENNIGGIGVDLDTDMVAYCTSHTLDVEQGDAISYLEKCKDKSLDGIFIDQVVEHLEPEYLVRLLTLCYQKLKCGYYLY